MTGNEFIAKWSEGLPDCWSEDASQVYWAASYGMPSSVMFLISLDFLNVTDSPLAGCCRRRAVEALASTSITETKQ